MPALVHERFEGDWQTAWTGQAHNSYTTGSHADGVQGLRIMFRKGSHYGCDLRQDVPPTRHVRMSYWVRVAGDWASHSTGKTIGFADLRWKGLLGQSLGHGNRRPKPDGFSFRTWFGKTTADGRLPIGMYVYHSKQTKLWGDSVKVGSIQVGADHQLFEVEADLDAGVIRARLDGAAWVTHRIEVGARTAVTTAWLDGYYGGPKKAPADMAMDVDNYRLDDLTVEVPVVVVPAMSLADEMRALADRVAAALV